MTLNAVIALTLRFPHRIR